MLKSHSRHKIVTYNSLTWKKTKQPSTTNVVGTVFLVYNINGNSPETGSEVVPAGHTDSELSDSELAIDRGS